jgi:DNA-binding transcriptional ArsR family regulator
VTRAIAGNDDEKEMSRLFESAASYFSLLSEPTRLKILHAICNEEKSVSEIVAMTGATQTNVSRHLSMMYKARVLNRRREGSAVYYSIGDPTMIEICRSVCLHVAADLGRRLDTDTAVVIFPAGKVSASAGRSARRAPSA